MTAKEKAIEIFRKIFDEQHVDDATKMICLSTPKIALFLVDEIIKSQPNECWECGGGYKEYWEEVKKEIENIYEK